MNFDEKAIEDWHDHVFILDWHVKKSIEEGRPDWWAIAFGFFVGRGMKIKDATKHTYELVQRDLLPKDE